MRHFILGTLLFLGSFLPGQEIHKAYRDGEVYLQLRPGNLKTLSGVNPNQIPLEKLSWLKDFEKKFGITRVQRPFHQASDHSTLPSVLKISFTNAQMIDVFIESLSKLPFVAFSEKVPLLKTDALPNDPSFPSYLNQINAQNAWNVFNGNSNITVAIVDNAVMYTHQDLVLNTYTNTAEIAGNSLDDDGNGYIDDVYGYDVADLDNNAIPTNTLMDHGTHCAGIAGARTDNSIGIASIGWNIKIIPVKCSYNTSGTSSIDAGYEGIIYAAKAKARVISCSWGGSGAAVIEQTVIDYAWNKGCIIIASAGNAGSSTQNYPGAYNHVYCVASVGSTDLKSGFSNYGSWVDISAPGESIYSTVPSASTGTYQNKSGTSMATPMVAGLAALMLSKCGWMSSTDVLNCISSTAVNIYTLGSNATYSTGNQLGAGRIEAFQAMNCANGFLSIPPVANFFAFPLNSCPNTPVSFYDSSLYAPNSYTWNFQNGTPATSTSSAPSVQWTSPGTYSVSLTVANGNGNNSKTKLSYITISGPQSLPFAEGFESLPFLPAGWTPKNVNYDNVYWQRHTGTGGFGTSTACTKFDNYNYVTFGDRDEMRTPRFDFSNVHTARLRYDVAYARINSVYSDTLEVKLSVNCGTTWSLVSIKGGTTLATRSDLGSLFVPTAAQWRRDTFDISTATAGQNNVMFSFINHGQYGQPIYLDNINLYFPQPSVNINPISAACVNTSLNPVASMSVVGSFTWNFPGGSPAISTQSNPAVSYATPGIYTVQLIAVNGTASTNVSRTLSINPYPVISVNSPSICSGTAANFSLSGASAYTFNPGGFNSTLVSVSPASTTIYTITGSNGVCTSVSNATAFVSPIPVVSANNSTICSGSSAGFTLTGATTYTTNPGNISGAQFTVSPLVSTTYSITGSDGLCSSSITATVVVNPLPNLSVNSASVCFGQSATLTASGASTYTWSNGSNANSIVVTPFTGTLYTVSGSSLNCVSSQTSAVAVNPSFTVSAQSASNNVCSGVTCNLSASGAGTYSWSTGASGQNISVNPVNSSTYVVTGLLGFCTQTAAVSISVLQTPTLSFNAVPGYSICPGGSATLQVSGAYSTFVWSQPVVNGTLNVVFPSGSTTYTVNATNPSNGCATSSTIAITVSNLPSANISVGNISCFNMCNGSVTAQGTNGVGPYSFTVLPVNCSALPCTNLCAGTYSLHIVDALGCNSTQSFAIASPAVLSLISIQSGPASCASCNDGSLQANVSGGTSPYTYLWMPNGGNAATALNLSPGCYTVSVTDANLCSTQSSACVDFVTGLDHLSLNSTEFLIFPNPAETLVTIEYQGQTFDCLLYNSLGQLVLSNIQVNSSITLNTEQLAKGVYFVELQTKGQVLRKKLVLK
ncbi:MAG: S8 family serine peptidase [Bacteroidia bacterium]|nr:S8 family serine peptidase [Bacteroidia bacterium]